MSKIIMFTIIQSIIVMFLVFSGYPVAAAFFTNFCFSFIVYFFFCLVIGMPVKNIGFLPYIALIIQAIYFINHINHAVIVTTTFLAFFAVVLMVTKLFKWN